MRLAFAFLVFAATAFAESVSAQSASVTMEGTVVTAISIVGADLRFGNVTTSQSKTIPPAAGGRFDVTLAANAPVSVTYVLPTSLGPQVAVGNWAVLYHTLNDPAGAQVLPITGSGGTWNASSPTGQMYFWIGGRVTTTAAAAGSYSAPITFTLTYN